MSKETNTKHQKIKKEEKEGFDQKIDEVEKEVFNQEADEVKKEASMETSEDTNKYDELNKKYLLLYSDFENFRKRTQIEKVKIIKTASVDVVKMLLPVLDDFDRAMTHEEGNDGDSKSIKEGFSIIVEKLTKSLEQNGLKIMEVEKGDDFDLDKHEAITKIPVEDKSLKGKVIDVIEKGYELNHEVIRFCKVVVGD